MARRPRLHIPGGLYHVTLRGNHRQPIFAVATDRDRLDSLVAEASVRDAVAVHAYCWMTNHVHALVEVGELPLGRFMQRVASQYARFLQRRRDTTGHLFERRYHAVLVDTDRYLLDLVRYIHLNPVRGGLVADPADYLWSSHRDYLGLVERPWVRPHRALRMLSSELNDARNAYLQFVVEARGRQLPSPLMGTSAVDPRVLGADVFVRQLPRPATDRPHPGTLEELIARTCEEFHLPTEAVRSAARTRRACLVRAEITRRALDGGVATCSDVARALGRSVSAISQALERARRKG